MASGVLEMATQAEYAMDKHILGQKPAMGGIVPLGDNVAVVVVLASGQTRPRI